MTTTTKTGTAVTKPQDTAVPAHLQQDVAEFAGMGNSQSAQDNTLPFLAILQSLSPQVNKQEAKYIPGAEAGMLFNTATGRLWSGDEGVSLIPCGYQKNMVEWVPRSAGGGYVDTHPFDLALAKKMGARRVEATKTDRGGIFLPNGNQLVETAYTFVILDGSPLVIGASSTGLKSMRDWMSLRNTFLVGGKTAPAFSRSYLARTVYQKNESGAWYNWKFEDQGWVVDGELYERAKQFSILCAKGEITIGRPDMDDLDSAGDDGIDV